MGDPVPLDREWLRTHPLAEIPHDTDKNERGRVVVIGGSRRSPGAVLLTGLAAFRAGAGKVQLATFAEAALPLGTALPEAGVIGLEETASGGLQPSEELAKLIEHCDTVVLGPGMSDLSSAADLLALCSRVLGPHHTMVVDAAAIRAAGAKPHNLANAGIRCVFTPHCGEMAGLVAREIGHVEEDPRGALNQAIDATGQVVLIKGATTHIGAPSGEEIAFAGGGPGLATGGSGDVLAGIIGALLARGQDPVSAAAWGTWVHGEAGRRLAERMGPIGYLARELTEEVPSLMGGFS